MMRKTPILALALLIVSCSGDDGPPPPPVGAQLVFPERNSECTTGTDVANGLSHVTFQWSASRNTDRYTLSVVNLDTNVPQTISTVTTSASLSIAKGTPFSWTVISRNNKSDQLASSETWLFYNAGNQTSYAPFPAQVRNPVPGSTVQKDLSGQILLKWEGMDVDGDIDSFEVYFSQEDPPTESLGTTQADTMEFAVAVESGSIYYWKVITTDGQGNRSDSGVFDFRVF